MNRESIHQFGENGILTGILTEPAVIKADDLCFVILNAGLVHHVGPFRMNVNLARDVANLGMPSFRFDLSGIGDSQRREGEQSDIARAVTDIRDAFDYLSDRKGFSKFVTFGLCSGADNAHAAGLQDQRLVGAVMLDGPGYPNFLHMAHHYGPKLLKIKPWTNKFKRLFRTDARTTVHQEINTRNFGPQNKVETEINDLVRRGVELLYIYSGGIESYYNHASQFRENFPSLKVNIPGSLMY